ncbi:hypothetical protein [Ghiorsea bivora]|uniref:hypothetical protein n=1 Tax=Ghiorsea bivora TaxID=1485545 RepID=UPI00056E763D|nr:hypothetical protein [Ghiorsea bivora]
MNLKKIVTTAAIAGALTMGGTIVSAQPLALSNFNVNYGTTVTSCALCHTTNATTGTLNAFGANFKTAGGAKTAYMPNWATLDGMDADADGVLNGAQIAAGNAPAGNGTLAAPTDIVVTTTAASSSGGGCVTSSLTTPLMMVLAMLSLGFFVRRKKD